MALEPPPPPPPEDVAPDLSATGDTSGTRPKRPKRPAPTKGAPRKSTRSAPQEDGTDGTDGTGSPRSAMRSRQGKPRAGTLQDRLEELFSTPALLYSFAGDDYAAQIVAQRTPAMAEAWADLAKQNPGVRRILERMTEGSAWGAVVMSTASVLLPLLQHHGVVPGADPFTMIYGGPQAPQGVRPIVPPPPSGNGNAPGTPPAGSVPEGAANGYTPPVAPVAPPGTVTVAGLAAIGAHGAVEQDA